MSLEFDMKYGVWGKKVNFHAQLIRLMMQADRENYARLAEAFPNTARVYEAWKSGKEIPDLPYE